MSDHEHDEHGNCIIPLPAWKFSLWDVAGIAITGVAGLFTVLGQAGNLMAREFAAQANYSRQNHDLRVAQEQAKAARAYQEQERAKMAAELERLIEPQEEA